MPTPTITTNPRRNAAITVALATLAVATLASTGCRRALFPENEPRTQYDRYDESRGDRAPMFIQDEFGAREPNLRGRLSNTGVQ